MNARTYRREMVDEMRKLNAYLGLIAEVIQKPEKGFKNDGWYLNRIEKAIRERPSPEVALDLGNVSQPLADAMELLARRLWLELPDESKEDLK